jgi:ubiquinone/menaquinone biosynthesis C-methylase UbiE
MNHEFDDYAKNYEVILDKYLWLTGDNNTFFAEYKAKKLTEWYPTKVFESFKMLDFGCGIGTMTAFVKKEFSGAQVYGIDPSSESIKIAQKRYSDISFQTSHGTSIDFEDNFFDFVYAAGAFHHIPFSEHEAYKKELLRVLKPGGDFVLFELNPRNPGTRFIFNRSPIEKNAKMLQPQYAESFFKDFGPITTKYYSFYPNFLRWLRPTEKYMTKIPFGGLYACLAVKK